ncbi:MAG: hypothetical protein II186_09790, partial [Erysipelotrichales bacterium]|nr:hypothetical protein [Erysipelotrichales bacterium]
LGGNDITAELLNFRITVRNGSGILYQDRNGLAYNFDGELGDGFAHFTRREPGEHIYGLGDKGGHVNKSGEAFDLYTTDSMGFRAESSDPLYKHIPFYICKNSAGTYGVYYDTYSVGRANFGKDHDNYFEPFNSMRFEEENMVFYLFFGTVPEIIRSFNKLTGGIAPVPEWAFHYCGSTMEYTDADNTQERLYEFARKCEENRLPCAGFYLSSGYTQIGSNRYVFHWNTDKIPCPQKLAEDFRKKGIRFLPNVKPAFLSDHPLYPLIAEHGWFLHYKDKTPAVFPFWGGMASYLDFTHPEAFDFWTACVKEKLADQGYTAIWNDNNEYDVWDKDVYAHGFGQEIPARMIRPLFPLLMSRASRQAIDDPEPFMVSRSAPAGIQRLATTWTGDNLTDFRDLRFNHYQAMTMALSGFAYFGQDIGGFAGPKPSEELFMRWLQYGVFTPRFVLHSWKPGEPSTMPWLYPELMTEVRSIFALRERLIPYLKSSMDNCVLTGDPLIKPVFLFDPEYDEEADWFFLGDKILACPVYDEGADTVKVLLPRNKDGWKLRGEGDPLPGGSTVSVQCTIRDLPVWFEKM